MLSERQKKRSEQIPDYGFLYTLVCIHYYCCCENVNYYGFCALPES